MSEEKYMGNLYQRFPISMERGEGARVWDADGKEYVDCMGGYGVALVGHSNKRVVSAIKEQADKIITVHGSLYSSVRGEFLEKLIGLAPKGIEQAHLGNSGAEAIEAAIKFAKKYTGKNKIVSMRGAYHGKSMGALSLTSSPKYKKSFGPMMEGVSFAPFGDAEALRNMVGEDTAMVIIEPIQGESGINVAPDGFLQEAREICDKAESLLAFDEIQSGLGRTGRMWACDHWGIAPDMMCLAKGLAGGVPISATLARKEILGAMSKGEHSSTFGGNPLACAAGTAALTALTEDGLISNAADMGAELIKGLEDMKKKHPIIRAVRGKGLMVGVELKFDVKDILDGLIREGVLMLYSGRNILRLLPPLVITKQEIAQVLHSLDIILGEEEERRNVR